MAYASDEQLPRLKPGMKVFFRFRDSREDLNGTIIRINPVPAVFAASPLLSVFGGTIKVGNVSGQAEGYQSLQPMFKVEIHADKPISYQQGRTLHVLVRNREILFDKCVSSVINFFRREF